MLAIVVGVGLAACSTRVAENAGVVAFNATDGVVLHGELTGSGPRAVVLAHGAKYHRDSWAPFARVLVERGFRVLAIDFRFESDANASIDASIPLLARDVLGAVRWLRANGATSVAVVGASLGGFAAGNAAVECDDGEIDRVVLLAHAPIDAPAQLKGRKLFVVAKDDPGPGGAPRLESIRAQFAAASEPKELVVLDGSAHAQALFDTDQRDRLTDAIVRFLAAP